MLFFCKMSLNLTFIVSFLDIQTQDGTHHTRHSLLFPWVVEILKYLHNNDEKTPRLLFGVGKGRECGVRHLPDGTIRTSRSKVYMEILFFILMLLLVGGQYKRYFYFQVRSKFPWARDALAQQMTPSFNARSILFVKTKEARVCQDCEAHWKMHDWGWGTYWRILFY